jgi:hypothetical protein
LYERSGGGTHELYERSGGGAHPYLRVFNAEVLNGFLFHLIDRRWSTSVLTSVLKEVFR